MDSRVFFLKQLVHELGLLLLKLRHLLYLAQIYNTLEGSCGIMKQSMNGTIWLSNFNMFQS